MLLLAPAPQLYQTLILLSIPFRLNPLTSCKILLWANPSAPPYFLLFQPRIIPMTLIVFHVQLALTLNHLFYNSGRSCSWALASPLGLYISFLSHRMQLWTGWRGIWNDHGIIITVYCFFKLGGLSECLYLRVRIFHDQFVNIDGK